MCMFVYFGKFGYIQFQINSKVQSHTTYVWVGQTLSTAVSFQKSAESLLQIKVYSKHLI